MEVAGPSGYDTIYNRCLCDLDTPIIIGVRRTSEALEKKNFSENLVDSKSCCTFAFATQKRGVPERARRSDWSEVSDAVSREMYGK